MLFDGASYRRWSVSFQNIKHGIYGGLAAGLVFGGLMGMMGTFPLIGQMVGVPSAAAGFFVYMVRHLPRLARGDCPLYVSGGHGTES